MTLRWCCKVGEYYSHEGRVRSSIPILNKLCTRPEGSSNHQFRKKRLIDSTSYADRPLSIFQASYIVNILRSGVSYCSGTILSNSIVITAANCVNERNVNYIILSGSLSRHQGKIHIIKRILKHPRFNPRTLTYNLALIRVFPYFQFGLGKLNQPIPLHSPVYIRPGTPLSFGGWGCVRTIPKILFPDELKMSRIPLMSRQLCQQYYREAVQIGEETICALDKNSKVGSCLGDEGGPLVRNYELVGVFSFRKGILNGRNPEIFTDVRNPGIRQWITSTMQNITMWVSYPRPHRKN
ncbi:trypsin-like [Belonocnema kinseyi]|uniref:trypsin-like n=1 Tax=Belonocnema kinseyi TaxID=2817044 RepID=UPI00143D4012|nr:trypsin-like [Belonocnema kinseyi]